VRSGVTGEIRYIALQRAKTARECVKLLGAFYDRYGVTYPSGIGIADTNEVWYIESGGGYTWAAVRVPDSCYWPQANGYRIGFVDPDDTANYYCSPALWEFCRQHHLWDPASGPFDFARAFGGGRKERNEKPFYDTRRVWRCMELLSPSAMLPPDLERYPCCMKPDEKITLTGCFSVLRDRYQNTPFEENTDDTGINGERPVGSWNAVHSDVIMLVPGNDRDRFAVLWAGIGPPMVTVYVPFGVNIGQVPASYAGTLYGKENVAYTLFGRMAAEVKTDEHLQRKAAKMQNKLERSFIKRVEKMLAGLPADTSGAGALKTSSWDTLSAECTRQAIGNAEKFLRKH